MGEKGAFGVKPSDAHAHFVLGVVLMSVGRPEEAIEKIQQAMRLDPHYLGYMLSGLGAAYALIGQYEEARTALHESVARNPEFLTPHILLAALYSGVGPQEKAQAEAAEVLRISPHFSLEGLKQRVLQKDPTALERFLTALHKAGLK